MYNRIVQNIPCDYDGFTISVDSVTGEITGYNRRWYSPDNAFSVAVDSPVKKYEAIFSIQQRAQEYSRILQPVEDHLCRNPLERQASPGSYPPPGKYLRCLESPV